jgi:hypothetical protein
VQSQNLTRRKYFITKFNLELIMLLNLWFNNSIDEANSPAGASDAADQQPTFKRTGAQLAAAAAGRKIATAGAGGNPEAVGLGTG